MRTQRKQRPAHRSNDGRPHAVASTGEKKRGEPTGSSPATHSVSVYDGQICLGHVVTRGRSGFEGFDANDDSLGMFPDQRSAALAVFMHGGSDA
jgi:hypothetical protein